MAVLKGKQLLVATIINLLLLGVLSYNSLPEAYCSLEDKTVKYIHMSSSGKTVTKVVPDLEGGFNVLDDRCQKGTTIEPWVKIDAELAEIANENIIYVAVVDDGHGNRDMWYCKESLDYEHCIRKDEIASIFI